MMDEDEKNYVCPICRRDFLKMQSLSQHITKSHPREQIDSIIEENNKRSQSIEHEQPPPRVCQLQVMLNNPASPTETSTHRFDIIENEASGDCLFLAVFEHLQRHRHLFPGIPDGAQGLRMATVNYIVLPTSDVNQSNFDRFKQSLIENLKNYMPALKNYPAGSEELSATEYFEFMATPGTEGTTAELCAMAEMFNFGFFVVRKDSNDNYSSYDYGSMDTAVSRNIKSVVFLLFTGSTSHGHFRLLFPDRSSMCTVIPTGAYKRIDNYSTTRLTSICPLASITDFNVEPPLDNVDNHDGQAPSSAPRSNAEDDTSFDQMTDLLVFVQTIRARTTVLKRIPKAARIQTAIEFTQLLKACTQPNAKFLSWAHLFTFAYIVFKSPDRKNKSTKNLSIATLVKRNLEGWAKLKRFPYGEFCNEILTNLPARKKSKTTKDAESIRIKLVQAKLSEGDISGAIRILSSDDTIAAVNVDTYNKLLEKHPESTVNIEIEDSTPVEIQPVSVTEIRKSISGFATGSSGGMDGIKPQHLKDIVGKETGEHGEKFVEALSNFSDFCLNGKVPTTVTRFLYGAVLCGLNKKDNNIRPIAVGNTLRRLVSRIASSRISERTGTELRPKQLGFGTRGGSEAGVHAARHFVNFAHTTTKVFVKLDFRNAYNEIERHPLVSI